MAKRGSMFDDLVKIGTALPAWLGVMLAAACWFSLAWYANTPVKPVGTTSGVVQIPAGQMLRAIASVGQYVVTAALLIGAAISFSNAWQRKRLYNYLQGKSPSTASEGLDSISWQQFESLVYEFFRRRGYSVTETRTGPDGGIDLNITRDRETATVQCKHWKKKKVGVNVIREQLGIVVANGASQGYVVASGEFTSDAWAFAQGKPITLIDGQQLQTTMHTEVALPDAPPSWVSTEIDVSCPKCSSRMAKRRARRGANAGREFWGCTQFPRCRGTRPM